MAAVDREKGKKKQDKRREKRVCNKRVKSLRMTSTT